MASSPGSKLAERLSSRDRQRANFKRYGGTVSAGRWSHHGRQRRRRLRPRCVSRHRKRSLVLAAGSAAQPEGLKEATLSGVRWVSLARIISELIAFGTMVALARLIAPSQFGEFAIAAVVTEIALTISGEGIGTALVQRRVVERRHLQAGLFMSICIGLVLGVAAFLTAPLIFTPLFGSGTTALVR